MWQSFDQWHRSSELYMARWLLAATWSVSANSESAQQSLHSVCFKPQQGKNLPFVCHLAVKVFGVRSEQRLSV